MSDEIAESPDELGRAIEQGRDEIEISIDVRAKVVRIKAVGKIAWGVLFGAVTVVIVSMIATAGTGGTLAFAAAPAGVGGFGVVVAMVGAGAAAFLVRMGVASRNANTVRKLYAEYDLVDRGNR